MKKLLIFLTFLLPMMPLHASQSKTHYFSVASATCTAIGGLGTALTWWIYNDVNSNLNKTDTNINKEKERLNKIENNVLPETKDSLYKIVSEHCDHEKPSIENRKKYVATLKGYQRELNIEAEV